MLVITGTLHNPPSGQGYQWREEPFTKSPPGNKFLLLVTGASHDSYQFNTKLLWLDPHHPSAAQARHIATVVEQASLDFWNYIFKHNGRDGAILKNGAWPHGVLIEHH